MPIPMTQVLRRVSILIEEDLQTPNTYFQWGGTTFTATAIFFNILHDVINDLSESLKIQFLRWKAFNLQQGVATYPLPFDFVRPYRWFFNTLTTATTTPLYRFPYDDYVSFQGDKLVVYPNLTGELHLLYYATHPHFGEGNYVPTNIPLTYNLDSNTITIPNGLNLIPSAVYAGFINRTLRVDQRFVALDYWVPATPDLQLVLSSNPGMYKESGQFTTTDWDVDNWVGLPANLLTALCYGIASRLLMTTQDKDRFERFELLYREEKTRLTSFVNTGVSPWKSQKQIVF